MKLDIVVEGDYHAPVTLSHGARLAASLFLLVICVATQEVVFAAGHLFEDHLHSLQATSHGFSSNHQETDGRLPLDQALRQSDHGHRDHIFVEVDASSPQLQGKILPSQNACSRITVVAQTAPMLEVFSRPLAPQASPPLRI